MLADRVDPVRLARELVLFGPEQKIGRNENRLKGKLDAALERVAVVLGPADQKGEPVDFLRRKRPAVRPRGELRQDFAHRFARLARRRGRLENDPGVRFGEFFGCVTVDGDLQLDVIDDQVAIASRGGVGVWVVKVVQERHRQNSGARPGVKAILVNFGIAKIRRTSCVANSRSFRRTAIFACSSPACCPCD